MNLKKRHFIFVYFGINKETRCILKDVDIAQNPSIISENLSRVQKLEAHDLLLFVLVGVEKGVELGNLFFLRNYCLIELFPFLLSPSVSLKMA
ncbi:unnamed protein product, partial [Oikopleura dioica]